MFLLYSILVPVIQFFSFGRNLFPFIIIIAVLYNYRSKAIVYKPLVPFLFLYLAQFLLIPFHNDVPVDIQLNLFRVDLMGTLLLPFSMINTIKHDPKALSLFNKVIIASILIALLYSLFLLTMPGVNPYIMFINPFTVNELGMDASYYSDYYAAAGQGRLFGRISGVFVHPMTNGLFLSIALIYILAQIFNVGSRNKKIMFFIFFVLIFVTTFLIGVRSAIGAVVLGLGVFILSERNFKFILYVLLGSLLLYIVFAQIPKMDNFVMSIFDLNSSNVSGSSFDMRLSQLNGALDEIKNNPFSGKGYGWTGYYMSLKGTHPILLAFESLIYVVLCNNGFIGVGIWFIMIVLYYRGAKKTFNSNYFHLMLSLIATYIAYSIITGEYGYMKYFLIFYSIMWMYGKENK